MIEHKMGKCVMDGAYEVAEIMLTGGIVEKWLAEAEELPHTLNHTIAAWYSYNPRIAAEDIVSGKIELRGNWYVLTIRIRRGKEVLAAFLNHHDQPRIRSSLAQVWLFCSTCNRDLILPWDSFGHMGGELVRQAIAASNEATCLSEGTVRRDLDSDHREPVQEPRDGLVGADGSE